MNALWRACRTIIVRNNLFQVNLTKPQKQFVLFVSSKIVRYLSVEG